METPASENSNLEQSIRRLEEIVGELEKGEQELETALSTYEEGMELARRCLGQLKVVELRIEELGNVDEQTPS